MYIHMYECKFVYMCVCARWYCMYNIVQWFPTGGSRTGTGPLRTGHRSVEEFQKLQRKLWNY